MAQLQYGDKYQVVYNGSEWVFTYTNDTALANTAILSFGVDPEAEAEGEFQPAWAINSNIIIQHGAS